MSTRPEKPERQEISVRAQETQARGSYHFYIPEKPWEIMTAQALGRNSLLEDLPGIGSSELETLQARVLSAVSAAFNWNLIESGELGHDYRVVDVLVPEGASGSYSAILQWKFDHEEHRGGGGDKGETWKDARGILDVSFEAASRIVEETREKISEIVEKNELREALDAAGLSADKIRAVQQKALEELGLDGGTLAARRGAFIKEWARRRGERKAEA